MNIAARCTIRLAEDDDLLHVLSVHSRLEVAGQPRRSASDEERQAWARMMAMPDLAVYIAECDNDVVGTATLMTMPNVTYRCAPTAFIEAVVVVHQHRRQGIATAMLARVLEDARSLGCNKVQLLSHKRHAADGAHTLYTRLGFEPEAEGFRLYLQRVPAAVQEARRG